MGHFHHLPCPGGMPTQQHVLAMWVARVTQLGRTHFPQVCCNWSHWKTLLRQVDGRLENLEQRKLRERGNILLD